MVNLGNKLKNLRLQLHMTQGAVGKRIGISGSMIGAYENGSRRPSFETFVKLAQFYQVSADYLLGMEQREKLDLSGLTAGEQAAVIQLVDAIRGRNDSTGEIE